MISKGNQKRRNQTLLEHLNQEDARTYAFGDGPNDIEMLQAVTHPVAMGNAIPVSQRNCGIYMTNNTDNGIINGLKHYGLI